MIWRRRKSLVSPREQIFFALELISLAIGFLMIVAFLFFVPPFNNLLGNKDLSEAVFDGLKQLVILNWPLVVSSFVILGILGVLMSHRMAGPIYGLKRALTLWMDGERSARVQFRKYDYLLSLKEPLNEFFEKHDALLKDVEKLCDENPTEKAQLIKKKLKNLRESGFTLLEVLVGLLIFSIGAMGTSAMLMTMAKGNQYSRTANESTTLTQQVLEDFASKQWNLIGTDTALPALNGFDNALIRTEGPINKLGQLIGTGQGPYTYYRYVVVCGLEDAAVTPTTSYTYCGSLGTTNRPPELACNGLSLTDRDKLVRVIVSWTDVAGQCRRTKSDAEAFNWGG